MVKEVIVVTQAMVDILWAQGQRINVIMDIQDHLVQEREPAIQQDNGADPLQYALKVNKINILIYIVGNY